jgi:NAD(P)-dependent dehydrogenase (short-subunit alcohol dehydrogenase family)
MRVWFITGASRGFGALIAKEALAAGDVLAQRQHRVRHCPLTRSQQFRPYAGTPCPSERADRYERDTIARPMIWGDRVN